MGLRNIAKRLALLATVLILTSGQGVYAISAEQKELYDAGIYYYDLETACNQSSFVDLSPEGKESLEQTRIAVWKFLTGKGLTPIQTAGWMANIQAESSFDPGAIEGNGEGHGLVQWSFERKTALLAAAQQKGVPWQNLGFQLDFMWNEISTSYSAVLRELKAADTLQEAHDVILIKYESPSKAYQLERQQTGPPIAAEFLEKYGGISGGYIPGDCNSPGEAGQAGPNGWDLEGPYKMVYYLQTDPKWADKVYGKACSDDPTIGKSGCGPTSMAMIISTLAKPILPPDMAKLSEENGFRTCGVGTSHGLAQFAADKYNLKYSYIGTDLDKAASILKSGGLVWMSVGPGTFTTGGHLMVLRKVSDDGRTFYVADPLSKEKSATGYTRAELLGPGNLSKMYGLAP